MKSHLAASALLGISLLTGCKERDSQSSQGGQTPPPGRRSGDGTLAGQPKKQIHSLIDFENECAGILASRPKVEADPEALRSALRDMGALGRSLSAAQLKEGITAGSQTGAITPRTLAAAAATALAAVSPEEFLEVVDAQRACFPDAPLLGEAFAYMAARQPQLLQQWLERSSGKDSKPFRQVALLELGLAKPAAALVLLPGLDLDPEPLLAAIARKYPQDLMAFIEKLPADSPLAGKSRRIAAAALAEQDPEMALQLIAKLDPANASLASIEFMKSWTRIDPAKAAGFAQRISSKSLYDYMVSKGARKEELLKASPALAKKIVEGMTPTAANRNQLFELTEIAAKFAPKETLEWVGALGDSSFSKDLLKTTMERALTSLGSGSDPLAYLPSSSSSNRAAAIEGMGLAVGDLVTYPGGGLSQIALLAGQLPAAEQSVFLEAALTRSSLYLPSQVMDMLAQDTVSSALSGKTEGVARQAGIIWSRKNSQEACDWVASQPEGTAKTGFVGGMMKGWIADDPKAAATWLLSAPAGPSTDAGIRVLADSLEQTDPETAAKWRASLYSR